MKRRTSSCSLSLRAEVREVERNFLHFGLEKRDGLLKGVALGARDAHDVALDGGRELEGLGVLDDALNGLCLLYTSRCV